MTRETATNHSSRSIDKRLLYLGVAVAFWLAMEITTHIESQMKSLPVKTAPNVNYRGKAIDPKNFYPVWVKQAVATAPPDSSVNVDAFFRRQEEPKPVLVETTPLPTPAEPDYLAMFRNRARIDGIADNGVFINHQFFKVGSKLDSYAMPAPNGTVIIPVVESITSSTVTFRVGDKPLRFIYEKKA